MPEPPPANRSSPEHQKVPDAVLVQILATEHWSLLAARTNASNESFSRASWFLTAVSATVVALALAADATDFGADFHLFALLLLPVVVLVGAVTFVRLMDLNREDVRLVVGMNRLRRGYLDLAPELESYFITGHHDDWAGIMRTVGATGMVRIPAAQYLSSTAMLVGIVDAVLVGALGGVACASLGAGLAVDIVAGTIGALVTLLTLFLVVVRQVNRVWKPPSRSPS
jgi:hypothetical protein